MRDGETNKKEVEQLFNKNFEIKLKPKVNGD
jgi:hypothetical protein